MNTQSSPNARRAASGRVQESLAVDQLLQEYLVWSAEALDVLVSLYEAVDTGGETPPEAAQFASRIGAWEDRLTEVLERLSPPARERLIALV